MAMISSLDYQDLSYYYISLTCPRSWFVLHSSHSDVYYTIRAVNMDLLYILPFSLVPSFYRPVHGFCLPRSPYIFIPSLFIYGIPSFITCLLYIYLIVESYGRILFPIQTAHRQSIILTIHACGVNDVGTYHGLSSSLSG